MSVGEPGTRIDAELELVEQVGSGGMGVVFRARNRTSSETVAVKLLETWSGEAGREALKRFEREVEILREVDHPNIVRVLNSGTSEDRPWYSMEYLEGQTLRELARAERLTSPRLINLLRQLAEALDYLHARGIVHRDLKPENVIVLSGDHIKLTDFGIATSENNREQITTAGEIVGTFDYMSPEQRHRLPIDAKSDVYSLGVIVFELLTGRRPAGRFQQASKWNPALNETIDKVLEAALAEEPEDRPESAAEFVRQLQNGFRAGELKRRTRFTFAGAVVIAAAALIATIPSGEDEVDDVNAMEEQILRSVAETVVPETKADDYAQLGEDHAANGDWQNAIKCYTEAIRIWPRNTSYLVHRAHAFWHTSMYAEALSDLDKALKLDPDTADARWSKGRILNAIGNLDPAHEVLQEAVKRNDNDHRAWCYLAQNLFKQKQFGAAREAAEKSITLGETAEDVDGMAYYYRSLLRNKDRDHKGTLDDLRRWLEVEPDNPFAWKTLAEFRLFCGTEELRNKSEALSAAQHACELTDYRDPKLLQTLARVEARSGQLPQAINRLRNAVRLAPLHMKPTLQQNLDVMLQAAKKLGITIEEPES